MPSRVSVESQRLADEVLAKRVVKERRVERIALGIGGFGSLLFAVACTVCMAFLGELRDYRFWFEVGPVYIASFAMLAKVFKRPPPIPRAEVPTYVPPPPPPPDQPAITRWTD